MEWDALFGAGYVTGRPVRFYEEKMPGFEQRNMYMRWYKGSIHNHTVLSDGDSSPEDVVRWYKRHGYNFVFMTDHNRVVPVTELNRDFGEEGEFLVLSGEEISDEFTNGPVFMPVHVNALGVTATIAPQGGADAIEVLRMNIDAVNAAGGLAMVNHPNFRWALTADDLISVEGWSLLEFMNCGASVNNFGLRRPDTEAMWDNLLGRGRMVFGTASDDSHHFMTFSPRHENPGRGWVMASCGALTAESVLNSLSRGWFYASTGVVLDDLTLNPGRISLAVEPWGDTDFRIEFIGLGGTVRKTVFGRTAEYIPEGSEGYIRARVIDSNGFQAWSQPVFLEGESAEKTRD